MSWIRYNGCNLRRFFNFLIPKIIFTKIFLSFGDMVGVGPCVLQEMLDMRYALTEQKREIQMLRELVKAMRISNPNARAIGNQTKSTH
jgi:hypothetical protein